MSKHTEIGAKGEQIATDFLRNKGYVILQRNWRSGKKELDLVAMQGDTVVVVETKTRTNFNFGFPEESVTKKKQQFLKVAAAAFMESNPQYINLRFDIISILMEGERVREIIHFEEAFY